MSHRFLRIVVAGGLAVAAPACAVDGDGAVTLLDGLSQPRGMHVDDEGVCVAVAGEIGPSGPVREEPGQLEADTGRVVCLDPVGTTDVVADGLPFVYYPDAAVTSGVADVSLVGDRLFALVGESYGEHARSIIEITPDGVIARADLLAHAVSVAEATGGAVLSNPFSFVAGADGTGFYVADAATGTVLSVDEAGMVETFAAVPGHDVLAGASMGPDGRLYVASFGRLPHREGSGAVVAIDERGDDEVIVGGLTMVIDVGFDDAGGMFVLEYSASGDGTGTSAYRNGRGRLLYVAEGDSAEGDGPVELVGGLDRPTALAVDGDDVIVAVSAGELAAGEGSLVRYSRNELMERVDR